MKRLSKNTENLGKDSRFLVFKSIIDDMNRIYFHMVRHYCRRKYLDQTFV